MKEFKAPMPLPDYPKYGSRGTFSIFLAGSIEMGTAIYWQGIAVQFFCDENINIFNPRRDNWDSSWKQDKSNNEFVSQVTWELTALEKADIIILYFDKDTKSPISLLELGLYANSHADKLMVCCPEGFWRKGNVDIVCERYGVKQYNDLTSVLQAAKDRVKHVQSLPTNRNHF
jgi:hypothetical protein